MLNISNMYLYYIKMLSYVFYITDFIINSDKYISALDENNTFKNIFTNYDQDFLLPDKGIIKNSYEKIAYIPQKSNYSNS